MTPVVSLMGTFAGVLSAWTAVATGQRMRGAVRARHRFSRGPAALPVAPVMRATIVRLRRGRDEGLVDRGLPGWLDAAARSARAGSSLRSALRDGASAARSSPVHRFLAPFVVALDDGASIDEALTRLRPGPPGSARSIAIRALRLAASVGGPSTPVLDAAAATLHERDSLAREVRALSTQARASAFVMTGAPVVFALGAVQLDSRVGAFFASGPGLLCVLGGVALDLAGAFWMRRIVRATT